jgi:hypothetical protein
MAFTDRFIKLPVEVYNSKKAEIMGTDEDEGTPSFIELLPMEIQSWHPHHDKNGEMEPEKTMVYFKGDTGAMKVLLSVDELKKRLNDFMK